MFIQRAIPENPFFHGLKNMFLIGRMDFAPAQGATNAPRGGRGGGAANGEKGMAVGTRVGGFERPQCAIRLY